MPVTMQGGKSYRTVQERLTAAHAEGAQPTGIRSIRTQVQGAGMGAHTVVVATVEFDDGRVFSGMSLARFDAVKGADATSPVECAETSAVGRVLAFAGYYGSGDGLASAEEIENAKRFGPVPKPFSEVLRDGASPAVRRPSVGVQGGARVDQDNGRPAPAGTPWPRPGNAPGDGTATVPQRNLLRELKHPRADDPGLTKADASALISAAKEAKAG